MFSSTTLSTHFVNKLRCKCEGETDISMNYHSIKMNQTIRNYVYCLGVNKGEKFSHEFAFKE